MCYSCQNSARGHVGLNKRFLRCFMKSFYFLSLPFIFLTGCATPYVAPQSGPTASIYFINASDYEFTPSIYEISRECKNRRSIKPLKPNQTTSRYTIKADEELTFQLYLSKIVAIGSSQSCLLNIRFKPVGNGNYSFTAGIKYGQCMGTLKEEKTGTVVDYKVLKWRRSPWDESGPFCSE